MVEVRGGKLRTPPAQPAIKAALAEEIASLRAEVEQRSSELAALVEDKVAAALDASGPKLQAEMDWFSSSIASRMDEQQRWFEDYRISAATSRSLFPKVISTISQSLSPLTRSSALKSLPLSALSSMAFCKVISM